MAVASARLGASHPVTFHGRFQPDAARGPTPTIIPDGPSEAGASGHKGLRSFLRDGAIAATLSPKK